MKEIWSSLTPWKKFKVICAGLLVIYVIIFAIVNWHIAKVDFLFFQIDISVTLLIILCLVMGYLISSVFDYKRYKQKDKEIKKLRLRIEEIEAENAEEIE